MWDSMKKFFTGFCMESSVHGVKYLIKDKNNVSRSYWCLMLVFAIFCCARFTQMLSSRFLDIPIRMTVKNKQALTELMPLPSITFCSEDPSTDIWYEKFLDNITLPDNVNRESALEAMRYTVSKVNPRYEQKPMSVDSEPLKLVDLILQYNDIEPRDFMDRVSVPCNVLLQRCQLRGEIKQCGDLFKRVRGQCCTFTDKNTHNACAPRSWWEQAKQFSFATDAHECGPVFASKNCIRNIVFVYPNHISHPEDFQSSGQLFGNSLMVLTTMNYGKAYYVVHEPEAEALHSLSMFTMNNGHYVMFYIDPLRVEKSEEVHEVEEYAGECAHPDDLDLFYFEKYDQSKCLTEKSINFSLVFCDCVGTYFSAPNQITCNFSQMNCLMQHPGLKDFRPRVQAIVNSELLKAATQKGIELQRPCPNSCEKTLYRFNFKPRNFVPMYDCTGFLSDVDPNNAYVVHFNYESQFYMIQEFVLITDWITLLSNLGGVYGLFLGCSMLTLVEIVYFLWTIGLRKMWNRNRVHSDPNLN